MRNSDSEFAPGAPVIDHGDGSFTISSSTAVGADHSAASARKLFGDNLAIFIPAVGEVVVAVEAYATGEHHELLALFRHPVHRGLMIAGMTEDGYCENVSLIGRAD